VLLAPPGGKVDAPPLPMSPDHVRLQHIRQVHEANGHNVSETARRLNMHRRTLQRILRKQAGKREVTGFRV
jgi:two-component system, response regulator RegA